MSHRFAVLAAACAGLLSAHTAHAADPDALWKIVHGRCVPDQVMNNNPAPCVAVSLAGGEAQGHAILKDINGATQYLLIPTGKVGGIESPAVLAPDAPNYFAAAWAAREAMDAPLKRFPPREWVSLAINSPHGRTQEQLHIHIDCLRADVLSAVRSAVPGLGTDWTPLPLLGHAYKARWLADDALAAENPFKLLAAFVGAEAMPEETLVLAGATSPDGKPGFVLLADRFDPTIGDRASGEELQDHDCAIAR